MRLARTAFTSARILAAAIACVAALHALPARGLQGTAAFRIAGRVVNGGEQPIAGATVRALRLDAGGSDRVQRTTDERGAFSFDGLAAGWYGLNVIARDYPIVEYGAARPGGMGTPIVLDASHAGIDNLTVRLPPMTELSGTVRQSDGSPMGRVRVEALSRAIDTRGRTTYASTGSAATDDRGEYRIDLPAGAYIVRASPPVAPISPAAEPPGRGAGAAAVSAETPRVGYAAVYYPAARDADDATVVEIGAEPRAGVDVLVSPVPFARVEGRIDVVGPALASTTVALRAVDARGLAGAPMGAPRVEGSGFVIADVPPGRYQLQARGSRPDGTSVAATTGVTIGVGQDVVTANLVLAPAARVTGRATFDGDGAPPAAIRLGLYDVSGADVPRTTAGATIGGDGTVVFTGVEPGAYRAQVASLPDDRPTWLLSSVRVDGRETVDASFDVSPGGDVHLDLGFTNRLGSLTGTVRGPDNAPAAGATVIVFPEDRALWPTAFRHVVAARPAAGGEFLIDRLLPGQYRVAAVPDPLRNEWFVPSFLEGLAARSVPVTIARGAPARLDLVAGGR